MPDGLTHKRFYDLGWAVCLPISISLFATGNYFFASGLLAGYGLGRYIDPDLDQIGITSSEGRIVNELSIVGKIIVGYSTIYGAVFRRYHRSFLTHFPGISTSIRLLYFFWWLYFVIGTLYDWQILVGVGAFFGLSFADSIHFTLDMFFPDTGKDSANSKNIRKKKV